MNNAIIMQEKRHGYCYNLIKKILFKIADNSNKNKHVKIDMYLFFNSKQFCIRYQESRKF